MELEQRREKKWLEFKKQNLRTGTNNNGVKNKTKNDKVFSNFKTDNITGVEVVDNQSERKRSVDTQRKKSYAEILKRIEIQLVSENKTGTKEQLA